MKRSVKWLALAVLAMTSCAVAEEPGCAPAIYQLADGSVVDIAPSDGTHLRWRRPDGTSGLMTQHAGGKWSSTLGWTGRDDGKLIDLSDCAHGKITFAGAKGHKLQLGTTDTTFVSDGTRLAGRLVMPAGSAAVPVVVLVHGSEDSSARRFYSLQRLLPAQGIGVFVYDKRGTGDSQGTFTHNLYQLAADAKAALKTAKSLAGSRAASIGYYGTSQGGWTAPLAATLEHVDFVIVGYGLAVSPIDEDREALRLNMAEHGFGAAETAKALEIGAAVESIIRHNFQCCYDTLQRVADKYRSEPWFRFVRGDVTGIILHTPEAELRKQGPRLFAGVLVDYDPMPVLRKLQTPQLWILGKEDIDAPYRETYRRLLALKKAGHPISIVVYPGVEHGLYAFETNGDERLSTRQPPSLERLLIDFARKQQPKGAYGDAEVAR